MREIMTKYVQDSVTPDLLILPQPKDFTWSWQKVMFSSAGLLRFFKIIIIIIIKSSNLLEQVNKKSI